MSVIGITSIDHQENSSGYPAMNRMTPGIQKKM